MANRVALFAVTLGLALAGSVCADDNVRAVQESLRDGGFYSGEIDGAYSSELAAALTRYQIRKGMPVTGQLDVDTSNALGAKPAVTTGAHTPERSSESWRQLQKPERQTSTAARRSETATTEARETSSPRSDEAAGTNTETRPRYAPAATAQTSAETTESQSAPAGTAAVSSGIRETSSAASAAARTSSETTQPADSPPLTAPISSGSTKAASAPPATAPDTDPSSADGDISTEHLRDYVGAFVHAGADPNVGSEADFFADRARYYDQGVIGREQIRNDLQNYAARWPERHFWFVGNITIEQQRRNRVRVTFPLQYELRNGTTQSSGRINKTLVLEPVGDNLQIVAVNEDTVK